LIDTNGSAYNTLLQTMTYLGDNEDQNPGVMNLSKDSGSHHTTITRHINLPGRKGFTIIEPNLNKKRILSA
jgi:hypothetical protein